MVKALKRAVAYFSRKINDLQLKHKLMILYGSLIVISIFIVGWFSYYNMNKYVYRQASDSFGQVLEQLKMNVEFRMQTYDRLLKQTASDKTLINALSNEYVMESDFIYDYLKTISKVFDQKETDENIIDILLYKNNKTLPEDGHNLFDIDRVKDKAWFKENFQGVDNYNINDLIGILKQKIWIVTNEDLMSASNNEKKKTPVTKVSIIKPIIVKYEKVIGILQLYIQMDSVFGEFKENGSLEGKHIFIANEDGKIIFDSDNPLNDNRINDEIKGQISNKNEGIFNNDKYGKFVLFNKGQDSNWTYFMELPMEDLFEGAKRIREFTIIIILLSTGMSFCMGIIIASMLSKRITKLSKKMEHVEDLNMDFCENIKGNDEIGKLARSYNIMICKIGKLVDELKTSQQKQKDTEIMALQAQINPHFLYNILATINWMALDNNTVKIIAMVKNLSMFYRLSLNKGQEYIKINDEINQVMAYVNIQKIRLEEKINVFYKVSENIRGLYTPKLILQPFVENAILHGAEYKEGTTNIIIKAASLDNHIMFEIIDDGVGMRNVPDPDKYPNSSGYGIRNVHEKVRIRFGNEYGVVIYSLPGIGTNANIKIPIIEEPIYQ